MAPPFPIIRRCSAWWLGFCCVATIWWQWQIAKNDSLGSYDQQVTADIGLTPDIHQFFYFFYYFGVFPVGAIPEGRTPEDIWHFDLFRTPPFWPVSQAGAQRYVREHGDRLIMDFSQPAPAIRSGDFFKLFLFLPNAWLTGSPFDPTVKISNEWLFNAALLSVLASFWAEGCLVLGVLIVFLVGSDSFQIFEIYRHDNINGLPICGVLIGMALHLRYMSGRVRVDRWAWPTAAAMGIIGALLLNVRSEAGVVLLAAPFVWLLVRGTPWSRRLALIGVLIGSCLWTECALEAFWKSQFKRAVTFVREHGGHPYPGSYSLHHTVWHPIYMGLGDYGYQRGYLWDDRKAFSYVIPRLRVENHQAYPYNSSFYYLDETYDPERWYRVYPVDLPGYDRVLREKVFKEIRNEPGWYLSILFQRLVHILNSTSRSDFSAGLQWIPFGFSGWWMLPTVLMLLLWRKWFLVAVIAFTFPLGATALFVYAGRGTSLYNIFHLMTLAVWLYVFGKGVSNPASRLYWRDWARRGRDISRDFSVVRRRSSGLSSTAACGNAVVGVEARKYDSIH